MADDVTALEGEELQALLQSLYGTTETEEKEEDPNVPFTGAESVEEGGYYSNPGYENIVGTLGGRPDRMAEPILEEEKDNPIVIDVVESEAYQNSTSSIERNRMIDDAIDSANREIYESKGEPTSFDSIRKQQFVNEDGEKRTFIVPKPGQESSGFQRTVGGALTNMVQGVGDFVEKGAKIPFAPVKIPGTDDLGITDPETSYFKEEFPTYPPANALEEAGQDIIPIIVGAIIGGKGVDKIDEISGLSKKLTNWFSKRWDDAKKVDPKNAKRKLETVIRGVMIERGANIGATVATPEDMEPLIGDDVAEYLGFDPETNKNLGHYIDNEAFTAVGRVGIKLISMGWSGLKGLPPRFLKNSAARESDIGLLLLKEIDPGITDDMPPELIAENAKLLGEIILNNKQFELGLLGQKTVKNADGVEEIVDIIPGNALDLDSGTALQMGARDYIEKAYGWMKETMSPEAYQKQVDEYTEALALNIIGLKQGRRGSQVVQSGESAINRQADKVLTSAADDAIEGGAKEADQVGTMLGEDLVQPLSDAIGNVQKTRTGVELAENVSDAAQDKDVIVQMLNKAVDENALGGSTRANTQNLQRLTGEDLYTGWQRSYEEYNQAFKNLPEDIPVDMADLKELIENLAKQTNDFDFVTVKETAQDPFREMLKGIQARVVGVADDGAPIRETGEEVLDRLSNIDLKFLYTQVRPELGRRLNLLESKGLQKPSTMVKLKDWIDDAADASGEPSFKAAMSQYEDHAKIYLRTEDLANWESQARKVKPQIEVAEGVAKGQEDAYELGMQVLLSAEQAATPGKMEAFLNALSKSAGKDVTPEMAESYVALAIRGLSQSKTAGSKITSEQVRSAIQPYLAQLEQTSPKAVKMFEDTVKELELVEIGVSTAKQANALAEKNYKIILEEAQERAASKFINNISGNNPSVMADPSTAFKQIFSAKNAPDQVADLLKQADEIGNPIIRDGIKSKYISYIKEKIFTSKRISSESTPEGIGATNEVSPTQLNNVLKGEFDNTLKTMDVIFKGDEQKAKSIVSLLDLLNIAVNNRSIRGNNFGSTTVLDERLKEKMNRVIVLTMGVLNPLATKARNISAALAEKRTKEIADAIETQIDLMLTSPEYFDKIMRVVSDELSDNQIIELLEANMIRGGIALGKEKDSETLQAVPPEFEETQRQAQ